MATNPSPDWLRGVAAALQQGDAAAARARIDGAVTAGESIGPQGAWLLAQACRRLGDEAGERAALHRILAGSPRDMPALLAMGQAFARIGDDRAAASWYGTALRQAAETPPPASLGPLFEQAQQFCIAAQARFAERLDAALGGDVAAMAAASPALRHALDLLHGRAEVYLQQPSMFYYPGLPQRAFYERGEFDWIGEFEALAPLLRDELLAMLAGGAAAEPFAPYVARPDSRPAPANPLLEDPAWGAAWLIKDGERIATTADAVPVTMAALAKAPQPVIARRSPMALYSRLKPGTHIQPHHGLLNTRLICHLPLIAPDGCALRVGHETRAWQFGEMLVFDDSFEHEAWNKGGSDRIVLLFEIWRPEIPATERVVLARLFEAIDAIDPAKGQESAA